MTERMIKPVRPVPPPRIQAPRAQPDGYAVAALVLSLVWIGGLGALLAVIFGNISRGQAKRAGLRPSAMAEWGTWLGAIGLAAIVLVMIVIAVAASNHPDPTQQYINCLNQQLDNPQLYCPTPGP